MPTQNTLSAPKTHTYTRLTKQQVLNANRKYNRSLTEVRPDAYIFDDGLHFEVRPTLPATLPVPAAVPLLHIKKKSFEHLNEVHQTTA